MSRKSKSKLGDQFSKAILMGGAMSLTSHILGSKDDPLEVMMIPSVLELTKYQQKEIKDLKEALEVAEDQIDELKSQIEEILE